jgi:hypothetical protein
MNLKKKSMDSSKIDPETFYSLLQAQAFLGMKTREMIARYIGEGRLIAITVGSGTSRRYAIRGDHLLTFKEKYDNGTLKQEKYSAAEVKMLLALSVEYCKTHGINTLDEMIKSINELNK